jgi:hypothetical protein
MTARSFVRATVPARTVCGHKHSSRRLASEPDGAVRGVALKTKILERKKRQAHGKCEIMPICRFQDMAQGCDHTRDIVVS